MDDNGARNRSAGSPQGQPQRSGTNNESLGDMVTGIAEDLQIIVRDEVQLAKTELKDDARQVGKAGGMIAAGGFLGLTGFVFLMLGVTYLINRKLKMWLSAGIVGLALVIIAAILGMIGKNQLQSASLKPEQTIESVKENKEWASRQMNAVGE